MKRATIRITGRVQGVFFRHSARLRAEKLGLTGLARNDPDGSVVAVVEGPKLAIEEFLAWCRKGPPLADIQDVTVEWQEATGEFRKFEII